MRLGCITSERRTGDKARCIADRSPVEPRGLRCAHGLDCAGTGRTRAKGPARLGDRRAHGQATARRASLVAARSPGRVGRVADGDQSTGERRSERPSVRAVCPIGRGDAGPGSRRAAPAQAPRLGSLELTPKRPDTAEAHQPPNVESRAGKCASRPPAPTGTRRPAGPPTGALRRPLAGLPAPPARRDAADAHQPPPGRALSRELRIN